MLKNDFFRKVRDRFPPKLTFSHETDAVSRERWQTAVAAKLRELIGIAEWTPVAGKPRVRRGTPEQLDGYTREQVWIEDGVIDEVSAYLLIPDPLPTAAPLILALHGHGGYYAGSAMIAGVTEGVHPIALECADALNYGYGVELVKAGFIVICPDAFNFGQRLLLSDMWPQRELCHEYFLALTPFGVTPLGLTLWGHQRALDFGLSLPGCNGAAGCVGLSFGGVVTIYLTAIEPRIRAAVCSGAIHAKWESATQKNAGCQASRVPGMSAWFDFTDVAISIAPRPVHYELMTRDCCFAFPSSRAAYETVQQGYARWGCEKNVSLNVTETDHRYDGTGVDDFLRRHLA